MKKKHFRQPKCRKHYRLNEVRFNQR